MDPHKGVPLGDAALRDLLSRDPAQGWRAFIDQYTPSILTSIEQAGITRRDDAMDLYVGVCEHLAADDCARLRRHDPAKGTLHAWLRTVARNMVVDRVRSRVGRRRLFRSIRDLPAIDRDVFELFYWRERTPSEIAELLRDADGRSLGLVRALEALERVERALTERQRAELIAMAARGRRPVSLDEDESESAVEPSDERPTPELALRMRQTRAAFAVALTEIPPEDALIISMKFVDGLTYGQIAHALHLPSLALDRVTRILGQLRARIEARGVRADDVAVDMPFLRGTTE